MQEEYKLRYLPLFYKDAEEIVSYISNTLENPTAAQNLIDDVEKSILDRKKSPESFAKYNSVKDRKNPYYRIKVRNFIVFYVVIQEGNEKIMEIRRLLYCRRNLQDLI